MSNPIPTEQMAMLAQKTSSMIEATSGPLSIMEISDISGFSEAEITEWSEGFISPWHWLILIVTKHWMLEMDAYESKLKSVEEWIQAHRNVEYQEIFMKVFVISRKMTHFYCEEEAYKINTLIGPELFIQRHLTPLLDPNPQKAMEQYTRILASSFLITGKSYFENVLSPQVGFPFTFSQITASLRNGLSENNGK
tara:strand:+ start:1458 stop:2042 length:585 start_codon:yes stop_codon:yes gene_type:complete